MSRQRKILCLTILLLYGISFLLPVTIAFVTQTPSTLYGYDVFLLLFIGISKKSLFCWVWYLNPVLWIGVLLLITPKWRIAWIVGCFALLLGIFGGAWSLYRGFPFSGHHPHLYVGYYVWLGSVGLLALSRKVLGVVVPKGTVP
jgi:hypothetical protein